MAFFQPPPAPSTPLGRLRILSPKASIRVSPFQLGCMNFGDAWTGILGQMSDETSYKMLDTYYKSGGNTLDTSNTYQNENSEILIGEWMKSRKNRHEMIVATKYTTSYQMYKLGPNKAANMAGNSRKSLHISLEDSLRKLQTDYIDILYVHWWDYTTSIEEVMDSLHIMVQSGKVLYLGISDTPAWIVATANQYAIDHGKTPFVIYQGKWNVLLRDFEREILPMCRQFGMAIAPWGASGCGRLFSKKQLAERRATGEQLRVLEGPNALSPVEEAMSDVLAGIAEKHGLESVTAVAIAYVMAKAPYVYPIVGQRKVEHLLQNMQALTIKLTPEEIKEIEDAKPFELGFPHDFLGGDPHVDGIPRGLVLGQLGTIDFVRYPVPL